MEWKLSKITKLWLNNLTFIYPNQLTSWLFYRSFFKMILPHLGNLVTFWAIYKCFSYCNLLIFMGKIESPPFGKITIVQVKIPTKK